jgi:hypothetical protein
MVLYQAKERRDRIRDQQKNASAKGNRKVPAQSNVLHLPQTLLQLLYAKEIFQIL